MEFSEKAFARQKFRSSRGKGRGRGGQHRGPAQKASGAELDSNAFRFEDDAEQLDDGVVYPKSQGADFEALLEDADAQFNQAFYRFRAQLQDITEAAPPLGATQPEQLLAIDLEQLSASLAALPLHVLLGLEPHYLEGLEPAPSGAAAQQRQPSPGQNAAQHHPQAQSSAGRMASQQAAPPSMRTLESGAARAGPAPLAPTAQAASSVPRSPLVGPNALAAPHAPAAPVAPATLPSAPPAVQPPDPDADNDPELEALLMGRGPTRPGHVTLSTTPAAVGFAAAAPSGRPHPTPGAILPPALAAAMAASRAQTGSTGLSVAGAATATSTAPAPGLGLPGVRPDTGASGTLSAVAAGPASAAGAALSVGRLGDARPGAAIARLAPASGGAAPVGALPAAAVATPVVLAALPASGPPGLQQPGLVRVALPSTRPGAAGAGPSAPQPAVVLPGRVVAGGIAGSAAAATTLPPSRGGQLGPTARPLGSGGAEGGGGLDEELRLLLGLPTGALGASLGASASSTAAVPQAAVQGSAKLGAKTISATLAPAGQQPPWGAQPQLQQGQGKSAVKSLDDWLDGL